MKLGNPTRAPDSRALQELPASSFRSPGAVRSSATRIVAALPYDRRVAYDEELADRIRELFAGESGLAEKKMFGGLAFLIGGNMAVAASGQGGLLVRVDPAQSDKLVATTNARLMEMRGRSMQGWLRVDPEDLRTKRQLAKWVDCGTTYARSLPVK
jgi:TfoX/Sxy family transcriptional regulator of competence genes